MLPYLITIRPCKHEVSIEINPPLIENTGYFAAKQKVKVS